MTNDEMHDELKEHKMPATQDAPRQPADFARIGGFVSALDDTTRAARRRGRVWRIAALVAALLLLVVGLSVAIGGPPAHAGPGCDVACGTAVNRSNYNMGIGILYRAWSNYQYDAIVYPGQSSTAYVRDFDKIWAGKGWCVEAWDARYMAGPTFTVYGPGWSGNINDWLSTYRLYAYPCGNSSGSW
jgi:hypothetical protein